MASNVFINPEQKRYNHHFDLFNLEYLPAHRFEEKEPEELEGNGRRELKLTPSDEKLGVRVTYLQGIKQFRLSKDFFTVDQIVLDIERRFRNQDFESRHFDFGDNIVLDEIPDRKSIEKIIRNAMMSADMEGIKLSRENKQRIELFFNQFLPKGKKRMIRENIEGAVEGVSTRDIQQMSARSGGLDHDISVFISEDYENELDEQNLFVLQELVNQDRQLTLKDGWLLSRENFNRDYIRQVLPFKHLYAVNTSLFRTPQDIVILSHEPERQFLFRLIEYSRLISSWVKSPNTEFYPLDYEYWKAGKDRVSRSFNPDFFIKIVLSDYIVHLSEESGENTIKRFRDLQDTGVEDLILVVEIKSDDDESESTRAKGQYSEDHFQSLNRRLTETNPIDLPESFRESVNQQYLFYVLRPGEYPSWFSRLRSGLLVFDLAT